MDGKDFILHAKRDAIPIAALRHALGAMELTNGSAVRMDGVRGILYYEPHIEKLKMALLLLGVDAAEHSQSMLRQ